MVGRRDVPEPLDGRLAYEDLAPGGGGADARGRVHALAVVVLPRLERPVSVDADADVELEVLVDRPLDRDRRPDRVLALVEGGEEAVPGVVDDLALEVGEDRAEGVVVAA